MLSTGAAVCQADTHIHMYTEKLQATLLFNHFVVEQTLVGPHAPSRSSHLVAPR